MTVDEVEALACKSIVLYAIQLGLEEVVFEVSFIHLKRQGNAVANKLAKATKFSPCPCFWLDDIPSDVVKTDTICSRLKELSIGTSAWQQSNAFFNTISNFGDKHQAATVNSGDGVPSLMTRVASVASSFGVPIGTGLAATIFHPSTSNSYLKTMAGMTFDSLFDCFGSLVSPSVSNSVDHSIETSNTLLADAPTVDCLPSQFPLVPPFALPEQASTSTTEAPPTYTRKLKELSTGTSAGQQSNGGAGQQSKEIVSSYTDASTSIVASSLADKNSHNNKQLWSKCAAEASDTEHQWACRDVLETIEAIPYHEVFIHSFGEYDTRGLLKELSVGTSAGQQSNDGAGQQSKEIVNSYTDASTSIVASSLADKNSHNNKQMLSKRAAEASDTEHQWACRDVLETIEAILYHEVFIHSFGEYDTRGL
nr:hypothetical protein CFP56_31315 [Quercus suber]